MRDATTTTIQVDFSTREFARLEQYAKERGLSVEQAASELAHREALRRIGAPAVINARVLPFRRR